MVGGIEVRNRVMLDEPGSQGVQRETTTETSNSHIRATQLFEHAHPQCSGRVADRKGRTDKARNNGAD